MKTNMLTRARSEQPFQTVKTERPAPIQPSVATGSDPRLLRDAVREAGLFQRSVLGHLDHKEWQDRVRADGQRLMDLLAEIGFQPSERVSKRSA